MHHTDSLGMPDDHPWVLSSVDLADELDKIAATLPPDSAALVTEAAARLREMPDD